MAMLANDLVCTTTLGKRAGEPVTIGCHVADLPANAVEKIFRYGFQRIFNDAVGGAGTSTEDKVKAAKDMLERFKRGEVGRTPAEIVDEVTAEARKIMNVRLYNKARTVYDKVKNIENKKARNAALDKLITANPDVMKSAEKVVATRAAEKEIGLNVDIDL